MFVPAESDIFFCDKSQPVFRGRGGPWGRSEFCRWCHSLISSLLLNDALSFVHHKSRARSPSEPCSCQNISISECRRRLSRRRQRKKSFFFYPLCPWIVNPSLSLKARVPFLFSSHPTPFLRLSTKAPLEARRSTLVFVASERQKNTEWGRKKIFLFQSSPLLLLLLLALFISFHPQLFSHLLSHIFGEGFLSSSYCFSKIHFFFCSFLLADIHFVAGSYDAMQEGIFIISFRLSQERILKRKLCCLGWPASLARANWQEGGRAKTEFCWQIRHVRLYSSDKSWDNMFFWSALNKRLEWLIRVVGLSCYPVKSRTSLDRKCW